MFTKIRITLDFIGRRQGGTFYHPQMYLDELTITGIAGGANWHIVDWSMTDM